MASRYCRLSSCWAAFHSSRSRWSAPVTSPFAAASFAPHGLEYLREAHQHRRLGFSDGEIERWVENAGLALTENAALPPADDHGLTVKIWTAARLADRSRSAA